MPPVKTPSREEATAAFVSVAFDDAYDIREQYSDLVARRKANREQLRSLASQGKLNDDQLDELAELYPARTKSEEAAEDNPNNLPSE